MRRYIGFSVLCIAISITGSVMTVHSRTPEAPAASPIIYLSSGTQDRYVVYESFLRSN
jgi:hypothetical protein